VVVRGTGPPSRAGDSVAAQRSLAVAFPCGHSGTAARHGRATSENFACTGPDRLVLSAQQWRNVLWARRVLPQDWSWRVGRGRGRREDRLRGQQQLAPGTGL